MIMRYKAWITAVNEEFLLISKDEDELPVDVKRIRKE